MKKLTRINGILASVLACSIASTAMANNVAVWNSQQAIADSNYGKAKLATIQASVTPKQQQLQNYQANINRLQQQYMQQKDSLTPAQKADLEKQVKTNLDNYDTVAAQIQGILNSNETDIMQKIAPKLQAIRDTIIKQKNIDILIDNRERSVSFAKPEWDVTRDFIQKINEQVK